MKLTAYSSLPISLLIKLYTFSLILFLSSILHAIAQQTPAVASSSLLSVDPISGIVHSQRLSSGMPLGGLGAGSFQIMTDGVISHAGLSGPGVSPSGDLPGCFAAIWTQAGNRVNAQVLSLRSAYKLPTVSRLDFDGLFPKATLHFSDPALSVTASITAFSPLVPFVLKDSSLPATAFIFHLKNPFTTPVDVSVALAWQSMPGVSGTTPSDDRDVKGVTASIIPSSEGYFGLRITGKQSVAMPGELTLMAYPSSSQKSVSTAIWNAAASRPGWWDTFSKSGDVSGSIDPGQMETVDPAGVVAVKFTLQPNSTVDIPFAVAWYTPQLLGRNGQDYGRFYQNLFSDSVQPARRLLDQWRSLLALTDEWQSRLTFSNLPVWLIRRIINSMAPLTANSVFSRDGQFAFVEESGTAKATDASTAGLLAEQSISDIHGADLARQHLAANALLLSFFPHLVSQSLARQASQWTIQDGLPPAISDDLALITPLSPSVKQTKDARSMNKYNSGYNTDSETKTESKPKLKQAIKNDTKFAVTNRATIAVRSVFVLEVAQYTLWTADRQLLTDTFPVLQGVIASLIQDCDADGLPTSVKEGSFSPGDLTLWLASLRAGRKLANLQQNSALIALLYTATEPGSSAAMDIPSRLAELSAWQNLEKLCLTAANRGVAGIEKRYWNGRFYAAHAVPTELSIGSKANGEKQSPIADVCDVDQLFGQWFASQLDLGPLLPADHIRLALKTLQELNDQAAPVDMPPVAQVFGNGKPVQNVAEHAPPQVNAGAHGFASNMLASTLSEAGLYIDSGSPDAGVSLLLRLDNARNNLLRAPWQFPANLTTVVSTSPPVAVGAPGDAADWNLLVSLAGFAFDQPRGSLTLLPNLPGTMRLLSCPIYAPSFWGKLEYKPTARGGHLALRIERLMPLDDSTTQSFFVNKTGLVLRYLHVPGPLSRSGAGVSPDRMPEVHVSLGRRLIGARIEPDAAGNLLVTFDSPIKLTTGDLLEVDVH